MAKSASSTRVSTKGQVILPKPVRDRLHWVPGTELSVEETAEGVVLKRCVQRPAAKLDDVFGSLRAKGQHLSLADMDAAVASEAARRARD
jgi:AbrB family looped-hinge helix DNA binding protein